MSSARGKPRGRTHGSGRSSSARAWLSYRSRTCFGLERPGRPHNLGMATSASWARSRAVVNMTKTSGHGRHGGCGLSKKNDTNVEWRKTARMATSQPRIWRKRGSPSWRGRSSNTTGGTVCGEEGQRNCGCRARETKSSCLQVDGKPRQWRGTTPRTRPKHAWKFVERGEQPVPVCGDGGYRLVFGDWSSKQWWPAWLRKELRELAAESRTNGNVLGPTGQAARKRRRARSTGPPGAE